MTNIFLLILGISASVGLTVIVLIVPAPFLNKRYAAKWKYLIWIFLALRLLVPFSGLNGRFVADSLPETKIHNISEEKHTDNLTGATMPYGRIVIEIPAQMTAPITVQQGKNNAGINRLDAAAFAWIIGSWIFILIHFVSYVHYKRQVIKKGKITDDVNVLSPVFDLKRELHIRRTIQVVEYCEAESPMIIGFLKPVLVLPKEQYSYEELFFILKHELVHFKRGDVYFKLLFVTANAVHWFNPLIWIMRKEAIIDMELSCDERVTKDAGYDVRKAYAETLLSVLNKRSAGRTAFSTQFYGGKNIMKKRFKNILIKQKGKNGIFILICAIVLTIVLGTAVGCSTAKEDTGNGFNQSVQTEPIYADNDNILKNKTMLTFYKEGEREQKQATLMTGDGYSLYLPDDEKWRMSGPDLWTTDINEEISLWITHFEGKSIGYVNQTMEVNGYTKEDNHKWLKRNGDLINCAVMKVYENDVWGIFYSYPADCEEGWGREMPVVADTFALSTEDSVKDNRSDREGEYLGDEDCREIRNVVNEFAAAYFKGDADDMQKFLLSTYDGKIDIYESTGLISGLKVKGLSDEDDKKIENGRFVVSLEFKDSNYEDMFMYLTIELVKEGDDWKIQFYGVEG